MTYILSILFILLLIIGAVILYFVNLERKRKETAELNTLIEEITLGIGIAIEANQRFEEMTKVKNGYFSNQMLVKWKSHYTDYYDKVQAINKSNWDKVKANFNEITTFLDYYDRSDSLRKAFNKELIDNDLKVYREFFDNIENRKLDLNQRHSIITDEDNNLIIAGAGSGKTTTIVGKIKYLIDRYNVSPSDILLISFTRKSVEELAQRISIDGLEAKTFHKLGKDIIVNSDKRQPSVFDENQYFSLIEGFFEDLLKDHSFLSLLVDFFINYYKEPKSQFEFSNRGDYIQYLKDTNFRTLKTEITVINGRKTLKREIVKSIEECRIANFLFLNNIEYEYEHPYEYPTSDENYRQYKPDFTINSNGKRIYLEHFAISREGTVPSFFTGDKTRTATKKYLDDMEWKRETHRFNNTKLIETYSYEFKEETVFDNLTKSLKENGINLNPRSSEEIWEKISKDLNDEVKSLLNLIATFITLLKSNNYSLSDISKKVSQKIGFERKRSEYLLKIINPIYDRYTKYLSYRNEIDFSDMINIATEKVSTGQFTKSYKYIIIDEFQDISIGRYRLIKALKEYSPDCKLFCVGDDWQSIYRFSGSDISLFKEFESYFGYTVKTNLETTYRFHEPLLSLSSKFILKNPNQSKKELKGISQDKNTTFKITYSQSDNQDDTESLVFILDELSKEYNNISSKKILLLSRYTFDLARIKNINNQLYIDRINGEIKYTLRLENGESKTISLQFLTIHKSKGLEGDIVIVMNCNSGKFGFPSELSDDPVLSLLLSTSDQFQNGEERRLFYVAMTRAKERVYFIAEETYKSKFISEIENSSSISQDLKCPSCMNANIRLLKKGTSVKGDTYEFYGCTNYKYGCDYTKTIWFKKNV